jgi:hypothetical protein
MNLKVANLIAVELGILIGLMSWLVYSRFPSPEPRTAAEIQENTVAPVATVASVSEPENQRPDTADYRADRERAQPFAEQPALTSRRSAQETVAPQPYASSGLENGLIAVDSPSYAEADQEAAVGSPEYVVSPQTVVYAQPAQIVVFSNPRRFANRCRSTPRHGAFNPIAHQCPDRGNSPLADTRIVSGPNVSTPSCPPTERFGPRGTVRQSGVTGSQQKRVAFPASPRAALRSLSVP